MTRNLKAQHSWLGRWVSSLGINCYKVFLFYDNNAYYIQCNIDNTNLKGM